MTVVTYESVATYQGYRLFYTTRIYKANNGKKWNYHPHTFLLFVTVTPEGCSSTNVRKTNIYQRHAFADFQVHCCNVCNIFALARHILYRTQGHRQ